MSAVVELFANTLGQFIPAELVCFIISMIPVLELRGGLLAASILGVTYWKAVIVCVIGNIIPIPFILLFIKQILKLMKKVKGLGKFAIWLENKAQKKSSALKKGEFLGLMLFVGIPLPGTGAWTGSLIAALMDIDIKKAVAAELCGLCIATAIMSLISYGVLGSIFSFLG
ncbi:MAG: small multi-drug export protein [Lachnospiraceae bacterium]|nr:small multi-drug export protein [Lachnospiraceae bacterium]